MTRVKVWIDKDTYIGEGEYVGNIPLIEAYKAIYKETNTKILMEKYCLNVIGLAAKFGISPPPEDKMPAMIEKIGKRLALASTPKIVLDTDETVYGCQVWWQEI
jgi:hypothetical protein